MTARPDPGISQAEDLEVLAAATDWLKAGQRVALATVLRTWGSSPRPPGSLLAISDAGRCVGSVSGGCIEQELVSRQRAGELAGPGPTLVDFGVDREAAGRLGLPCGGRLELLVEHLTAAEPVGALLARLHRGELVARRVCLDTGEVSLHPGIGGVELELTERDVIRTFGPAWQLLLIGDGQIARHLASMARQLDYWVTICDPREGPGGGPPLAGVRYSRRMPDEAVGAMRDRPRSAIVALAHDPRQDDLGLSAALETPAFYIGALGSSRSARARRARLQALGHSDSQIARVHGPAGLPIGSKRPAEIALSILAEITAVRNGVAQPSAERSQATG